jgi:5-(carboxyamino)imidazole ribonucleotide mutase
MTQDQLGSPGTEGLVAARPGSARQGQALCPEGGIAARTGEVAALVGVAMGSTSDLATMRLACTTLDELHIAYEVRIISAHRTPHEMLAYGREAARRGLKVLIAGAGGAAHLPGMLASVTTLPVIGVPVPLAHLDGIDSLVSIMQMPAGVPVGTVSIGSARDAALLAARILALAQPFLTGLLEQSGSS